MLIGKHRSLQIKIVLAFTVLALSWVVWQAYEKRENERKFVWRIYSLIGHFSIDMEHADWEQSWRPDLRMPIRNSGLQEEAFSLLKISEQCYDIAINIKYMTGWIDASDHAYFRNYSHKSCLDYWNPCSANETDCYFCVRYMSSTKSWYLGRNDSPRRFCE